MRTRLREITAKRIAIAAGRRIATIPDKIAWKHSAQGKSNQAKLAALRNVHLKQRCVIMANGPGLNQVDFSKLATGITFSFNRAYAAFNTFGFEPTYFCAVNDLVLEQFCDDIAKLAMPKFLSWSQRSRFAQADNICYLRTLFSIEDSFNENVGHGVYSGATVTFQTLQLAYHMGFSEVIIVGMDHNFAHSGTPNKAVQVNDKSHFIPNYFPPGTRWELPDLHRTEIAYAKARLAFERAGRRIIDASVNGKCKIFERENLEDLL